MLATSTLVRRSVLIAPIQAAETTWRHDADAIALDLGTRVACPHDLVSAAAGGGAEVFACIDRSRAYAQIKAAVGATGLTGVVVPNVETGSDIHEICDILSEREREEGVPPSSLEVFPLIGTGRGIWNVREVVNASPRVRCAAIDEPALCRSLDVVPTDTFDPFGFSRGRLIVETLAAVKLPLGIGHPLGARPRDADSDTVMQVADRARNAGFKGALCPFPTWISACNRAFTPSDEQVAYYREVRKAFAEGIKRGTAAVPFAGGRMIDVPVDERAKLVIDWWERCRTRDAEKASARSRAKV
jgi:citrate lyase subunit beta / citryl-CoA lyase